MVAGAIAALVVLFQLPEVTQPFPPQPVCVTGGVVHTDGVPVATVLRVDGMGRPLLAWPSCRRLRPGELFLLSTTNPASFDSRYFGPVRVSAVLGIAHPLWLETRR